LVGALAVCSVVQLVVWKVGALVGTLVVATVDSWVVSSVVSWVVCSAVYSVGPLVASKADNLDAILVVPWDENLDASKAGQRAIVKAAM